MVQLIEVNNCYACGSAGVSLYSALKDFQFGVAGEWSISKCSNSECGLMWLNPRPQDADLSKLYEKYYTHGESATPHQTDKRIENTNHDEVESETHVQSSFYQKLLSGLIWFKYGYPFNVPLWAKILFPLALLNFIEARRALRALRYVTYVKDGHLLDVGCGEGNYIKKMQDLGWNTRGLDFDEDAIRAAQAQGLNAAVMDASEFGYDGEKFDVITIHHVLEHVPDPANLIEKSIQALKPGGIVRIFVPNQDSLSHRIYGPDCFHLDPPRHLFHYNVRSLRRILESRGVKAKIKSSSVSAYWNFLNSITTRKLRFGDENAQSYSGKEKLKSLSCALIESIVCICGANLGEQIEIEITK